LATTLAITIIAVIGAMWPCTILSKTKVQGGNLLMWLLYESCIRRNGKFLIPEYGMFGFIRERTGASSRGFAPSVSLH